jgi:hypothetical protein
MSLEDFTKEEIKAILDRSCFYMNSEVDLNKDGLMTKKIKELIKQVMEKNDKEKHE